MVHVGANHDTPRHVLSKSSTGARIKYRFLHPPLQVLRRDGLWDVYEVLSDVFGYSLGSEGKEPSGVVCLDPKIM